MGKSLVFNFHKEENSALFEKMVIALKKSYHIVGIDFLERSFDTNSAFNNICHITFDDGEKSFYKVVFPILKKHHVPATLFVSPGMIMTDTNYWFQEVEGYDAAKMKKILAKRFDVPLEKFETLTYTEILKGLPVKEILNVIAVYQLENSVKEKSRQNMTRAELKEVEASGLVTIGAHTLNHPILQNEDDKSSRHEITGSIIQLGEMLGHTIKYFAYPNGRPGQDFGEREIQYLKENSISICFSTELDHLSVSNNRLAIPRMGYPTMGLSPGHPLISARLFLGKHWIDIRSIFKPGEKQVRQKLIALLNK